MEAKALETLIQLGFAGAIAIIMIYIIWKLGDKTIVAFKEMHKGHSEDMKEMQKSHKVEREKFYDTQSARDEKFDETIRFIADKFQCKR